MQPLSPREALWQRLAAEAARDPRIVGLLDYGSSSEGRADEWSDVDAALFVRDADFAAFEADWRAWLARFGRPLLTVLYQEHHPWAIYDAAPVPLRADFDLHPESAIPDLVHWPNAPVSVATMLHYDGTDGRLAAAVQQLVGKSLAPPDPAASFERVGGLFWYFLLRAYGRFRRGQTWAARYEFGFLVIGLLHAILRLEAGRTERWQAVESPVGIEAAISPERLAAANHCAAGPGDAELLRAMLAAARLAQTAGAAAAAREGWPWPQDLAERVTTLLTEAAAVPRGGPDQATGR